MIIRASAQNQPSHHIKLAAKPVISANNTRAPQKKMAAYPIESSRSLRHQFSHRSSHQSSQHVSQLLPLISPSFRRDSAMIFASFSSLEPNSCNDAGPHADPRIGTFIVVE